MSLYSSTHVQARSTNIETRNKSETRNLKSETAPEPRLSPRFETLILGFVSGFEIRISCFREPRSVAARGPAARDRGAGAAGPHLAGRIDADRLQETQIAEVDPELRRGRRRRHGDALLVRADVVVALDPDPRVEVQEKAIP